MASTPALKHDTHLIRFFLDDVENEDNFANNLCSFKIS